MELPTEKVQSAKTPVVSQSVAATKPTRTETPQPSKPSSPDRSFRDVFAGKPKTPSQPRQASRQVVESYQLPVIVSHVEAPRTVMVGREATYMVTLENTSDTPAQSLTAVVQVPEWAEVMDSVSTSGVVQRIGGGSDAGAYEWRIHQLTAKSAESLRLRLIPKPQLGCSRGETIDCYICKHGTYPRR